MRLVQLSLPCATRCFGPLVAAIWLAIGSTMVAAAGTGDTQLEFRVVEGSDTEMESIVIGAGKAMTKGRKATIIIEPGLKVLIHVDHQRKVFTRVSGPELEAMFKAMYDGMAELTKILGDFTVDDPAAESTIAGIRCRSQRLLLGKEVLSDTCFATADQLKLPAQDAAVLRAIETLFTEMTASFGKNLPAPLSAMNVGQARGLPIRQTLVAGGVRHTSELARITHDAVPASAFAIPAGYKEEKFGG